MRIILDGCDWTGKTYLVNDLAEKTWWPVIKFSAPKTKNPFKEWAEYYNPKKDKFIWDNVILDRCRISEHIYGPLKGRNKLKQEEIDYFKKATKNDIYIITNTSIKNIEKVFKERWEDYINLDEAKIINEQYFKFLHNNYIPWLWLMYDMEFMWNKLDYFFNTYIKWKLK